METSAIKAWIPPEGVTRHSGGAIPQDADFFVAPPPEIGKIITAESTLTTQSAPMSVPMRLLWAAVMGAVCAAVLCGIFWLAVDRPNLIGFSLIALIAVVPSYISLAFRCRCSFVGEAGIAEFHIKGTRTATPTSKKLLFKEAGHLYTGQTKHYKNGSYRYTSYNYQWTQQGSKGYTIAGTHNSKSGNPLHSHEWHFANSAEGAWTRFLLDFVNQDLTQRGYVEFPMAGNPQMVRVGQGFLEFVTNKGEIQRAAVNDMKDIELESGHFQFRHQDSRWWSGKGRYGFSYNNVPNAKLFWLCLHQIAGVAIA